jgi:hypothetical protein
VCQRHGRRILTGLDFVLGHRDGSLMTLNHLGQKSLARVHALRVLQSSQVLIGPQSNA